jgi:DNA polymerase III subunit delta'
MTAPKLWSAVVAQDRAVALLDAAARQPVHAYLFLGPRGSTKTEAARAFSAALLCPNGGCGECRDCRLALAGEHPDVQLTTREGAAISAAQAEDIVSRAALAPVEGRRKVLVLDEFHLLRPEAAARLLKTIEEPSASTIFIVLADDLPPELVTIASRCVRVEFGAIPVDVVERVLVEAGVDAEQAAVAARSSAGDLDRARDLAHDPDVAARRAAFAGVPERLDGTGAAVAQLVDDLLGRIDSAAASIKIRHAAEIAEMQKRLERAGVRGGARRELDERHKRELRRLTTDELRAGLAELAGSYRQALVVDAGTNSPNSGVRAHETTARIEAVAAVHEVLESLERNPNIGLLLQSLLLRLPAA